MAGVDAGLVQAPSIPRVPFCAGNALLFDFGDACVREAWGTLLPVLLIAGILFVAFSPVRLYPFKPFLTLDEAEELEGDWETTKGLVKTESNANAVPWLIPLLIFVLSLGEAATWIALGCYSLYLSPEWTWNVWRPFIVTIPWLYTGLRPLARPFKTVPADLVILFFAQFALAVLQAGGIFFDHDIYNMPLPGRRDLYFNAVDVFTRSILLVVVFQLPVGLPSAGVDKTKIGKSISPEDYTTLWGWCSFHWVLPLIRLGTNSTLNEPDVWELSPTLRSKPVFSKFSLLNSTSKNRKDAPSDAVPAKQRSLLKQLWKANAFDITLDFLLTFVSVVFNYASPFFLKHILDAIDNPTPGARARAYIYACLAFCCTIAKSQADVQHLWFGRRAATNLRTQLMAAIYEKALKRKDLSGVVNKDGNEKKDKETENDPKAGADIGKIVNLMSGDTMRMTNMISGLYFIYGAPFEIIIASTFLYQLLGISAFAGFLVLIICWPLNSYIARRSIRIQKGVLASKDKRMTILNELILGVKFVKFFAWEDRWIQRVIDARNYELKWMLKARKNSVMFSLLWMTAPILVSIVSFMTYVMRGEKLTVGTAFTAIALFNMIRAPLNVIPTWIVSILQTRVSLERVETFLNEEEVNDQVSSLKQNNVGHHSNRDDFAPRLGLRNANLKWNEIPEEPKKDEKDSKKKGNTAPVSAAEVVDGSRSGDDALHGIGTSADGIDPEDRKFELQDISIEFPEGELSVVTGPTASGKTALLLSLLGELTLVRGELLLLKSHPYKTTHTAISYAAQSPWLQNCSIKDNIVFGHPLSEERYHAVIEACALVPDFEVLEDGDETEIGARGVSLSGGQKARVALARAVYAPSRYVLLDDPLSAVDSHTARFLYEKLFQGPLLKGRTVILVTHHVELVLPGTYYIVRMLDGRIDMQGTVQDLRSMGALKSIEAESAQEDLKEVEVDIEAIKRHHSEATGDGTSKKKSKKKPRQMVKDEARETGSIKWSIYKAYLRASSYWTWAILVFLIVAVQMLNVTERLWIMTWGEAYGKASPSPSLWVASSLWSTASQEAFSSGTHHVISSNTLSHIPNPASNIRTSAFPFPDDLPSAEDHPLFYVVVYAAVGFGTAFVGILSVITQITGALRASRMLFAQLLSTVVHATMRWHDVTPAGRMLNRFSRDIGTIDLSLAGSLQSVNQSMATFTASVLVVIVVFPVFLIPTILLGFIYYSLAVGYLNTGRDLRRMESNSRSPIFQGFGEVLEGIVTLRAFSAEQRFMQSLHEKVDLTTKMWYSFWMTNRYLLLHFDALSAFAVLITTLLALSGFVRAGIAGLCITSAMSFTTNIYWTCRNITALELDLNSVERIVEYLDLPQEPAGVVEASRPPAHWPSSSNNESMMVVEDLVVRYAPDLPDILHGVSFSVKSRERVGLLGRTGSGKSTLAMSLLRFVDPASGRILIDGVDITTIGVHDLRSRLTFIPQDATLFSGTLRDNLDPFDDYTDVECLDALHRVQLLSETAYISQRSSRATSRAASPHGESQVTRDTDSATQVEGSKKTISLDTKVSAGGSNFSQGQRQLIAMARALLRQSTIIILDEATSSIDFATDAKVQRTIREEFNNSLLLTIAHRLRTVIDYDRLIVLDQGTIAEFDTPFNLIQKEGGIFREMCLKSGTFAELEQIAREKAEQSHV